MRRGGRTGGHVRNLPTTGPAPDVDGHLQGLLIILSWPQRALLVAGVPGGLLIGALPSFTSTMALVVLLPLSFTLAPIDGILLLSGVYVGGIGGGCIPAIALNISGTPASAATTLEGFTLFNKRGRSEEALGIGVIASAIGGMTGALVLMTLAPQISRFALRFGPAEYFALGLLGLTLVISVPGPSVVRGRFVAFVGALLVMVGTDPMVGMARFTIGNVELLGGISYVAALIGLFGFSEILQGTFAARGVRVVKAKESIWRLARVAIVTVLRILPAAFRSGGLGAFIGSIPGAGVDIAVFVSYEVQKQLSRDSSAYGAGEARGIAASESGFNANAGGAMVPPCSPSGSPATRRPPCSSPR
jgi:putative tricarboxylic transport membrane protein